MERINNLNLTVICVDRIQQADMRGRLYCRFEKFPVYFKTLIQMTIQMERIFDAIKYPQASTETRYFEKNNIGERQEEAMEVSKEDILEEKGQMGTFIVKVMYRQNATWQGEITWAEKQKTERFRSALELIKMLDNALDERQAGTSGKGKCYGIS